MQQKINEFAQLSEYFIEDYEKLIENFDEAINNLSQLEPEPIDCIEKLTRLVTELDNFVSQLEIKQSQEGDHQLALLTI